MMNALYQTYGRKVGSSSSTRRARLTTRTAARADAVKAVEELGAFAVWGGPALAPAWTEEIKARGVICLGCPAIPDPEPVVFPIVAERRADPAAARRVHHQEARRKATPSSPATPRCRRRPGSSASSTSTPSGGPQAQDAADFKQQLSDGGVDLSQQIPYTLDPATLQEQAAGVIQKLKAAGVTTVILTADPIAPKIFTEEATKQNYFPEWIFGGGILVDTNAFGRTYDQKQWAHAFGISYARRAGVTRHREAVRPAHVVLRRPRSGRRHATACSTRSPALFFAALQAAGPKLTADTFRDGLFGSPDRRDRAAGVDRAADHLRRSRPVAGQRPTSTASTTSPRSGGIRPRPVRTRSAARAPGMLAVRRRRQALPPRRVDERHRTRSTRPVRSCITTSCPQRRAAELSAAARLAGRGAALRRQRAASRHHTQRVARCANSSSRSMMAKARCGTTSHIEWLVTKVTMSARFAGSGSYLAA